MTHQIKLKDGFSGERAYVLPPAYVRELEENPRSAILHITDIGYYPNAAHHYRKRQQPIMQYVLIYCVNGRGWYELNGMRHEVTADSYFILPPGVAHSYGACEDNPWTIYWVHYKGTLASEFIAIPDEPIEIKSGMESRIRDRIDIFEEIMSTLDNGYSIGNLLYACSAFHHFLGSLHHLDQFSEAATNNGHSDMVSLSIKYMKENIEKPLRLRDIAAHMGYSVSHYSALFAKATDQSPVSWLLQLKISKACSLLDFSDLKINQICHMVGIDDPYYFSRIFKKIMGVSPRTYRAVKKG